MYQLITLLGILVLLIGGLFVAVWYGRKTKKFYWSEYFGIVALPSTALVWAVYRIGPIVLYVYLIACIAGPVLEYILGKAYHLTIGKRLWTYKASALGGYTSLYVIPYWGLVGVCVVSLVEFFN